MMSALDGTLAVEYNLEFTFALSQAKPSIKHSSVTKPNFDTLLLPTLVPNYDILVIGDPIFLILSETIRNKMPTSNRLNRSSNSSQLPRVLLQVNPGIARQLEKRVNLLEKLR